MIDFLLIAAFCLTMALGLVAIGLELLGLGRFSELVMAGFCLFGVLLLVLFIVRVGIAGV